MLLHLAFYLTDHHSTSLLALTAAVALFALGGIGASRLVVFRLTPERLDRLRDRVRRWRGVALSAGLLIGFVFGLGIRPELIYPHIALMLAGGFALAYDLFYVDAPPLSRLWLVVLALVVAAVLFLRLNALSVSPNISIIDEPWDLSWAMGYVHTGRFFDPIAYFDNGDIQRFMLLVAWWIELVGTGFWQVRLFFFLLILPLIAMTGRVAHNLYGRGTGWLVMLVMLCSVPVWEAARIRHDIGLALALTASLLLYTEALKRERASLHFFAGLLMGWGWFAHYHAIGFGVAMAISLYLPRYVERIRRGHWLPERALLLYVAGGLLGAASVFTFQILPDLAGSLSRRQPRIPQTPAEYADNFIAYWRNLFNYSQIEFALVITGLAAALWRHRRSDVLIVLLALTLHASLALQSTYWWEAFYLVPIAPIYAIAAAALFLRGARAKLSTAVVMAALFLAPNLGLTLQRPVDHFLSGAPIQLPTPPAAAWVRQHVDPDQRVAAKNWYYLFLTDYDFVSPETWPELEKTPEFPSLEARLQAADPAIIIIDPNLGMCCDPIFNSDYLAANGYEQVAQFPGEKAPILIYEKGGI